MLHAAGFSPIQSQLNHELPWPPYLTYGTYPSSSSPQHIAGLGPLQPATIGNYFAYCPFPQLE